MGFITYLDLKDDSRLPPSTYYTEPRDLEKIYTLKGETLPQFMGRVEKERSLKGYPPLSPSDLRLLVLASLEKTCNPRLVKSFFTTRSILPQFSQVAQVISTLVSQIGSSPTSYELRQSRASKCEKCIFHKPNTKLSPSVKAIIRKALDKEVKSENLSDLEMSPKEKLLGTCGACGCDLQLKLKVSLDATLKNITTDQLTKILTTFGSRAFDMCWILEEASSEYNAKLYLQKRISKLPSPLNDSMRNRSSSLYSKATLQGKTKP